MKNTFKIILFLLLIASSTIVYGKENSRLTGILNSQFNGFNVYLTIERGDSTRDLSSTIQNGKFYFEFTPQAKYEHIQLYIEKDKLNYGVHFFAADQDITIKLNNKENSIRTNPFEHSSFKGVYFRDFIMSYKVSNEYAELQAFNEYFSQNWRKADDQKKDSIIGELRKKRIALMGARIKFLKANLNSYPALFFFCKDILDTHYLSADSIASIYNGFSADLRATPLGHFAEGRISNRLGIMIGKVAPAFDYLDLEGSTNRFFIKGNGEYTLLCFWASWCGPCIKNIPILKEIQSMYGSKRLKLISVSIDHEKDKWIDAVQAQQMPWLQALDIYGNEASVMKIFVLYSIPQYFLLDPTGKIIYHNDQSGDNDNYSVLKEKLNYLLKY